MEEVYSYEGIEVGPGVATLTRNILLRYNYAYMTVEGGTIRYRVDGPAPSQDRGHLLGAGATLELYGQRGLLRFKAFALSGTVRLHVSYGRPATLADAQ